MLSTSPVPSQELWSRSRRRSLWLFSLLVGESDLYIAVIVKLCRLIDGAGVLVSYLKYAP